MKLKRIRQALPALGLSAYLAYGVVSSSAMSPEMKREASMELRLEQRDRKVTNKAKVVAVRKEEDG